MGSSLELCNPPIIYILGKSLNRCLQKILATSDWEWMDKKASHVSCKLVCHLPILCCI